jgi:hypothetical protein
MKPSDRSVRALGALILAALVSLAMLLSTAGLASAAPTAEFSFGPKAPAVRQPVTFTFDGTCDVEPCSVEWRWFQNGGSSLGTSMGRGTVLTYAFASPGIYTVRAKITNATSTHGSAVATQSLEVADTFEENHRRIAYDGWVGFPNSRASNDGYRYATNTDVEASYGFTGTAVTYVAWTGPDKGIAAVSIDGTTSLVDLYAPEAGSASFPVEGLADGPHRIGIRPTGTKNDASEGTFVTVDEFVDGTTRVDDTSGAVDYNTWAGASNPDASGGSVRNSVAVGARTSFAFWGPSVTWVSAAGPDHGIANVTVDGAAAATIDGYSPTQDWQVEHTFTGLGEGRHVLKVTVDGSRNASSTGNRVVSDAFIVR